MTVRLIAGFALLQVALLGLLTGPSIGDAFTSGDLRAALFHPQLAMGASLPALTLYDQRGPRVVRFDAQPRPATVVFSGCAPCNISHVQAWSAPAMRRGDRLVTVFDTTPDQLAPMRRKWNLQGEVYASRGPGIYNEVGIQRLPVVARVMGDGIVLAVDSPNS